MTKTFSSIFIDEQGQGLVEYALIIALIAVALSGSLTGLKTSIAGVFTRIGTSL